MEFWKCMVYLALVSFACFLVGRLLPAEWFRADCFPFRTFLFEKEGRIYGKLHIRRWQNRLPDMSRILPGSMPPKRLESDYREKLPELIRETCVAELIHGILCILGLWCIKKWKGIGGWILAGLNLLGNAAYILIQRYNRPRLVRLLEKCTVAQVRLKECGKSA